MKIATRISLGLLVSAIGIVGCSDDDDPPPDNNNMPTLTSIAVAPATVSLAVGANQQLTVTGTFSDGSTDDVSSEATFTSNDAAVASVSATGLVTAVAEGMATIVADVGGTTGTMTVTVTPPPPPMLESIAVAPETATIDVGATQQLTVTGTFDDSSTSDQTSEATFMSNAMAVATVSAGGLITGVSAGTATITASVGSLTATMVITINQPPPPMLVSIAIAPNGVSLNPGATSQLTVNGTFDDNSTQNLTDSSTFMSNNEAIATVSATGLVTAVDVGTATITGMADGLSATTVVTVGDFPAIPLPLVVDDAFQDRAGFGSLNDGLNDGLPSHTEDDMCPMRGVTGAVGECHRFVWDGVEDNTGTFWTDGEGFDNARGRAVEPGATEVRFYAWAASGTPRLTFGPGIGGVDLGVDRIIETISTTPTQYTIPLVENADYTDVFGAFSIAANNTENPGGFTIYIDDIQWIRGPVTVRADPADITIWDQGGNPTFEAAGPAAGGTAFGAPAAGSSYVIPFVLPEPPAGGFTTANLRVVMDNIDVQMGSTLNADLYALPFRSATQAAANGVVQLTDGYVGAAQDPNATLIADDFMTPSTPGAATPVDTDMTADQQIVNYLNAQVAAGAGAGDYVLFRLSPDADHPIGAPATTFIVSAAADALGPPNRPTLTVQ